LLTATVLGERGELGRARGILEGMAAAGDASPLLWRSLAYYAFVAGDGRALLDCLARVPERRWTSILARLEVEHLLRTSASPAAREAAVARLREHLGRWPRSSFLRRLEASCAQLVAGDAERAAAILAELRARRDLLPSE